eukprot:TRINITY_DN465_c3_g1_i1.p1 TRINITY_DN465_c3_g1~~TRINITY_DN465_c3_g1_i1.p1  ORF type:complete len:494 (-),score=136.36 TRINITY_DN465_c3_g1_i1:126-1607(-)
MANLDESELFFPLDLVPELVVDEFVKLYQLKNVVVLKRSQNTTIKGEINSSKDDGVMKKVILRVSPLIHQSRERIENEVSFLNYLKKNGVHCCHGVHPNLKQVLYCKEEKKLVGIDREITEEEEEDGKTVTYISSLFKFGDGIMVDKDFYWTCNDEFIKTLAYSFAKFHKVCFNANETPGVENEGGFRFPNEGATPTWNEIHHGLLERGLELLDKYNAIIIKNGDEDLIDVESDLRFKKEYNEVKTWVDSHDISKFTFGINHGDCKQDNFSYKPQSLDLISAFKLKSLDVNVLAHLTNKVNPDENINVFNPSQPKAELIKIITGKDVSIFGQLSNNNNNDNDDEDDEEDEFIINNSYIDFFDFDQTQIGFYLFDVAQCCFGVRLLEEINLFPISKEAFHPDYFVKNFLKYYFKYNPELVDYYENTLNLSVYDAMEKFFHFRKLFYIMYSKVTIAQINAYSIHEQTDKTNPGIRHFLQRILDWYSSTDGVLTLL